MQYNPARFVKTVHVPPSVRHLRHLKQHGVGHADVMEIDDAMEIDELPVYPTIQEVVQQLMEEHKIQLEGLYLEIEEKQARIDSLTNERLNYQVRHDRLQSELKVRDEQLENIQAENMRLSGVEREYNQLHSKLAAQASSPPSDEAAQAISAIDALEEDYRKNSLPKLVMLPLKPSRRRPNPTPPESEPKPKKSKIPVWKK